MTDSADDIAALARTSRVLERHAGKLKSALMRGARNGEHRDHLHRTIKGFLSAARHAELLHAHLVHRESKV